VRKFKFRLQSVLDIRQKELEDQQIILAKLLNVLETQKRALHGMELSRTALNTELSSLLSSDAIKVDEICNYRAFLEHVSDEIKMQNEIIKSTNEQIRLQQFEVTKAYKAFKTLERLKEVQGKAHYKEIEMYEVKEVDDITNARYQRAV